MNRDRLLNADIAKKLIAAILAHEKVAPLLSDDHFSVDGTLIEAWASFKSFKPKAAETESPPPGDPTPPDTGCGGGGTAGTETGSTSEAAGEASEMSKAVEIGRNVERDWRGQTWSNATHTSVTDPDARLYRKAEGKPAQLCYMGHALTENRNGFVVEATLTHADGTAERRAAIDMIDALDPGSIQPQDRDAMLITTRGRHIQLCSDHARIIITMLADMQLNPPIEVIRYSPPEVPARPAGGIHAGPSSSGFARWWCDVVYRGKPAIGRPRSIVRSRVDNNIMSGPLHTWKRTVLRGKVSGAAF